MLSDAQRENFTAFGSEFFRIVQADDAAPGIEYDRRSDHGPE